MSVQVDKLVKTYRALAQIPALTGAQLLANGSIINSVWSQRNLERGKTNKYLQTHIITTNLQKSLESIPIDITNELLSKISSSEKFRAVIRDVENKDGHKQYLEIWKHQNLANIVDLVALDLHGDVYTDGEFGALEWSPDETKLLYVAEKKTTKSEPFYKRKPIKKDEPKPEDSIARGEEYLYRQDWGEQLTGKFKSVVVEFDISIETVTVLTGIPDDVCPAQPVWGPDGKHIVGIALKTLPRKLGLIYCSNRPSKIFSLDFSGNYVELESSNKSVKSPRITPNGKNLIWLQRDAGGPHACSLSLMKADLPLTKLTVAKVIVDAVEMQIAINNGRLFYGIYSTSFPGRCWASESRLLLTTNQKNSMNTYVIDIDSGHITELEYDLGSQIVLDIYKDVVIANRRNFFCPDKLIAGRLPAKGQENNIEWQEISEPLSVDSFENYTYHYMDLEQTGTDEIHSFSAIYVGPKFGAEKEVPLVVWPHGGPHSAFSNNFALEFSVFASIGCAMLLVNYRGSIGAGNANVNFLLGKIGQSDVSDCVLATNQALQKFPWLDPNRVVLMGGSHGGFLVTHLSGQYPDMFKAVVARNPVIDVASMSIISDIPDWSFVEAGSEYTEIGEPNEQLMHQMRKMSPIEHAHKVKAPTLLQIGSKDLRVPALQGFAYYHRLKSNGVLVRMNLYDDNHPLGSVPNEMDNIINSTLWILDHIKQE